MWGKGTRWVDWEQTCKVPDNGEVVSDLEEVKPEDAALTNRVKRLFGEQKFQKSNIFLEGSGHQNFMNPFVYGKSFLGKSFSKKNWNPNPTQPKDI